MNTIPFAKAETTLAEILKNKDIDFNKIAGEDDNKLSANAEHVSMLQPFKIFEPASRNVFGKWETDFLIDYIIKTHHAFAKRNAVSIYDLTQKVVYRHSHNHPELLTLNKTIFLFLHDLLNQMSKEEQALFPYIRQIAKDKIHSKINSISQSLKGKIKLLQNEHAKMLTYLKVLRQVTNNYRIPSDACDSYNSLFSKMKKLEDDLTLHFHLEEDILFPNAITAYKYD